MKLRTTLLFLLILLSVHALAQGMIPHTYNMSTPHGNVPITYFVPMPRYYGGYQQGPSTYKLDYTIALSNDSLIKAHTKINLADTTHFIKVKRGKEKVKIYPKDTKRIYCTNFSNRLSMEGIPADSVWLFKTQSGKINTYTFIPETDSPYVIALQKGNGPILGFTEKNVTDLVADNEEALKLVQKKKLMKAVKVYNKESKPKELEENRLR